MRASWFLASALASVVVVGCDGAGASDGGDGGSGATSTSATTSTSTSTGAPASFEWAGNWTADLTYTVSCDVGFGTTKTANQMQTLSFQISGANDNLTGTPQAPDSGYTPMAGTGDDTSLTISGEFPFLDLNGNPVSSGSNTSSVKITSIASSKSVTGTFQGHAPDNFGDVCSVMNAAITLSR